MEHHDQNQSKPSSSSSSSSPGSGGGTKREDEEVPLPLQSEDKAKAAAATYPTFFGKHRMTAAISHLQNQINIIQDELNQLETLGVSSIVCKELVSSVGNVPDPLLPMTKGPLDVGWDRWFRGSHNSRNNKRWI
ncbi:hypothetical protein FEM48_Zijuj06G0103400 [Ziziphus jujuba var. spinosa]|uniref:Guanine nucleotide-binding protein subunit gamma 2-like n=1 Tax=Ziziphus jujuba var. spinosa TaxID=714518 RepID=A0A978V8Q1_ZIZJJ|nr:hypothetical protein FEM48_Zijuj06G0103400 [Ziziphus jujuba var. spinosa]